MKWKKFGTRQVALLFTSFAHIVFTETLKDYLRLGYSRRVTVLKNGMITTYCYENDFQNFEKLLTKKIIKDRNFIKNNIDLFYKTVRKLIRNFDFIKKIDLKKISNRKLYNKLLKTEKDLKIFSIYGPLTGRMISGAFQENILRQAKKSGLDTSKIKKYVSQLVIPVGEGINIKEEKELIKILKKIDKQPKVRKIFLENRISQIISKLKNNHPTLYKETYNHYENYTWLPVFLENPAWPLSYFIKKIKSLLKNKKYIIKLSDIERNNKEISLDQKKLIKELKLPPNIVKFIYQAGQYLTLRTLFGQRLGYMRYNLNFLYKEIARRYDLRPEDFKYLTIQEVHDFLLTNKKVSLSLIKKRRKFCILDSTPTRHKILLNKDARKLERELEKSERIKTSRNKKIKGAIANKGRAQGKVKIIFEPGDIQKFKRGNILVASMTSVDMISAIKKAKALVTDEGGLTCHAAIISREFNKPCVIGTKIATEVLKDEDLIEVDANKGVVKILK